MSRRLSPTERRAREADKAYRRALTVSVVSGDQGGVDEQVAQLKADAEEARKLADEEAKLEEAVKGSGLEELPHVVKDDEKESSSVDRPRDTRRARGRVGRATDRELVDRPAAAIAGGAGLFWRLVVLTLAIVLLGVILRSSGKAVTLLESAGYWTTRLVYPRGAFGNYADQLHNRSAGKPLQGPPAPQPRRTP
jgi:hypothetical protein